MMMMIMIIENHDKYNDNLRVSCCTIFACLFVCVCVKIAKFFYTKRPRLNTNTFFIMQKEYLLLANNIDNRCYYRVDLLVSIQMCVCVCIYKFGLHFD